jgi:hypothetical protein
MYAFLRSFRGVLSGQTIAFGIKIQNIHTKLFVYHICDINYFPIIFYN